MMSLPSSPAITPRPEVPRRTSELLVPTMVAGTSLNVARSKQLTAGHNPRDKTNMSYG